MLTFLESNLTAIEARLTLLETSLKTDFSTLSGGEATEIQISAGSVDATTAGDAAESHLMALQALTVNEKSLMELNMTLSRLADTGSLGGRGEEINATDFIDRLSAFFMVLEEDISSFAITALTASITNVKVELNETENALVSSFNQTLNSSIIKIQLAMAFYQEQFKAQSTDEATSIQILTGSSSATLSSASALTVSQLKTLTVSKHYVTRVQMLCEAIAEDAVKATESGTVEMTADENHKLVMELFISISENFLDTNSVDLITKIQSAKLIEPLDAFQKTATELIVSRLTKLAMNIQGTMQIFHTLYTLMTCETLAIIVVQARPMTTTRSPGMMTTGRPGMQTTRRPGMMTTGRPSMQTTRRPGMMTTGRPRPNMMTTGRPSMMTTKRPPGSPGTCGTVDIEVEVPPGHADESSSGGGPTGFRKEWLKSLMMRAYQKYNV